LFADNQEGQKFIQQNKNKKVEKLPIWGVMLTGQTKNFKALQNEPFASWLSANKGDFSKVSKKCCLSFSGSNISFSFDKPYPYEEVRKMLPSNVNLVWLYVYSETVNEKEGPFLVVSKHGGFF
jgi:hypothetical protein